MDSGDNARASKGRSRASTKKEEPQGPTILDSLMESNIELFIVTGKSKVSYVWRPTSEGDLDGDSGFAVSLTTMARENEWPKEILDALTLWSPQRQQTVRLMGDFLGWNTDPVSPANDREVPVRVMRELIGVSLQCACGDDTEKLKAFTSFVSAFADPAKFKQSVAKMRVSREQIKKLKEEIETFYKKTTPEDRKKRDNYLEQGIVDKRFSRDEFNAMQIREAKIDTAMHMLKDPKNNVTIIEQTIETTLTELFTGIDRPGSNEMLIGMIRGSQREGSASPSLQIGEIVTFINKDKETKPGIVPALTQYFKKGPDASVSSVSHQSEIQRLLPHICKFISSFYNGVSVPDEFANYRKIQAIVIEMLNKMMDDLYPFTSFPDASKIGGGYRIAEGERSAAQNLATVTGFLMHVSHAGDMDVYSPVALYFATLMTQADVKKLISDISDHWKNENIFEGQNRLHVATDVVFFLLTHAHNPVVKATRQKTGLHAFYMFIEGTLADSYIEVKPPDSVIKPEPSGSASSQPTGVVLGSIDLCDDDDDEAPVSPAPVSKDQALPAAVSKDKALPAPEDDAGNPAPAPEVKECSQGAIKRRIEEEHAEAPAPKKAQAFSPVLPQTNKVTLGRCMPPSVFELIDRLSSSGQIQIADTTEVKKAASDYVNAQIQAHWQRKQVIPKTCTIAEDLLEYVTYVPAPAFAAQLERLNGTESYKRFRLQAFAYEAVSAAFTSTDMGHYDPCTPDKYQMAVEKCLSVIGKVGGAGADDS